MPGLKLKTVTRTQGNNAALKDGTVRTRGFEFDFEEVDPLIAAFRRSPAWRAGEATPWTHGGPPPVPPAPAAAAAPEVDDDALEEWS